MTDPHNHLKVLAFTNQTASHKWRLTPIAERLNRPTSPHEMFVAPYTAWNHDIVGANIVVLEMLTSPDIVDECHAQGAKVIYEADDAVIDSYGHERKNLQHLDEKFRGHAIETIRKCDAVTVTNKRLADNYARFTDKPVYVLPNYMDFEWYGRERLDIRRNTNEIRVGWFGSKGHFEDLRWVLPALERVLASHPQVRLVYCGYGGMSSDRLATETRYGEDVFAGIPRERREFVLPVDEDLWPMKHRMLDLDIGLAPLIDDEFNHCKTPIKWMEYGILETPAICSPPVYGEHFSGSGSTVKNGQTGIIASTLEEWASSLTDLIENPSKRSYIGKNAREEVLSRWDLDAHIADWISVYEKVLYNTDTPVL